MLNPYANVNTLLNDQFNKSYEVVKTVYDNLSVLISVNNRITVINDNTVLRAFTSSYNGQVIFLAGVKNIEYKVDYSDSASLDNGDTVIIGADGKRWKKILVKFTDIENVENNVGFVPELKGTDAVGTATYTRAFGTYSRLNSFVTGSLVLDWDFFTGDGDAQIHGLPYVAQSSSSDLRYGCSVATYDSLSLPPGKVLSGYIKDSEDFIRLTAVDNIAAVHVQCASQASGSGKIWISFTYQV
jgi:hypothetical protein